MADRIVVPFVVWLRTDQFDRNRVHATERDSAPPRDEGREAANTSPFGGLRPSEEEA